MADTTDTGSAPKPCPFCGGKASFNVFIHHDRAGRTRAIASDPAERAAIISDAVQLNKAEDEINERSEEEDRE